MLHLRPLCCYQDVNSDYLSIFLKTSIDSFAFDNSKIKSFRVKFENKRKLRNKLRLVYNELSSRLKNMGTGEKENSSAVVVPLSNGMRAFVSFEKDNVSALWGNIAIANDIDIEGYKDAHEDSQQIKDYDYFEDKLAGIEFEDTTVGTVEEAK